MTIYPGVPNTGWGPDRPLTLQSLQDEIYEQGGVGDQSAEDLRASFRILRAQLGSTGWPKEASWALAFHDPLLRAVVRGLCVDQVAVAAIVDEDATILDRGASGSNPNEDPNATHMV